MTARRASRASWSTCPAADISILLDLKAGPATATVLTTDLTVAYVHENSAYST